MGWGWQEVSQAWHEKAFGYWILIGLQLIPDVIHLNDMANLKSLNELLTAAAGILDTASAEIQDIPLNPKKENISKIGHALTLLFEIQNQIYQIAPDLEPEFLKRPSPFPAEVNRRFDEILIEATDLCDEGKYKDAISLYEEYISENPPDFFIQLAKGRIKKIRNDYDV